MKFIVGHLCDKTKSPEFWIESLLPVQQQFSGNVSFLKFILLVSRRQETSTLTGRRVISAGFSASRRGRLTPSLSRKMNPPSRPSPRVSTQGMSGTLVTRSSPSRTSLAVDHAGYVWAIEVDERVRTRSTKGCL